MTVKVSKSEQPARRRVGRAAGTLAVAIALGVGLAFVGYHVSPQPGAAIVKTVFERSPEVTPPRGYRASTEDVEKHRVAIRSHGNPVAHLDLFNDGSGQGRPLVLWIHGGGFISSSSETVEAYSKLLASEGFVVASLDYTLAPTAQHPTQVQQANAALGYMASHAETLGVDATKVVIGGDSAGAQMASELAAALTNPRLAARVAIKPAVPSTALKGAVLFCGLFDMDTVGGSGFPALRTYLWSYTGHRDWTDAPGIDQLSTTKNITPSFPTTFLATGDADPFHGQAQKLETALRAAGVTVTTNLWTDKDHGLGHEYQFNFTIPEARTTYRDTLRFLRQVTS